MLSKTRIEFKTSEALSDFMKAFLQSENAKELFYSTGNDGTNYFVELNTHWVENGSY